MTELARLLALAGLHFDDLLLEGAKDRYNQLFQNVPAELKDDAALEVQWAMQNLKKEDRIIWYLRYVRVALLKGVKSDDPKFDQYRQKVVRDLAQKSRVSETEAYSDAVTMRLPRTKTRLAHSISMEDQIAKIKNYVFSNQRPDEVLRDMEMMEDEWKDENDGKALPPTETSYKAGSERKPYGRGVSDYDDAEKVIDFGDGFAWWNLGRGSCSLEGKAMGHCGNVPSEKSGDRILSLRKRSKVGGQDYDTPYLTFILDRNNRLGEMKGRANEKPAAKYHKYIIALLMNDIVEGIKGGGYAPQNNFSLSDLDADERERILDKKPELNPIATFDQKVQVLRDAGLHGEYEVDGNDIIVWTGDWSDMPDSDYKDAIDYLKSALEDYADSQEKELITPSYVYDLVYALETSDVARLARIAGADMPRDFNHDTITKFAEQVHSSPEAYRFLERLAELAAPAYSLSDLNEFVKSVVHDLFQTSYSEVASPSIVCPDDVFEGTFKLILSNNEFEALAEDISEGNEEEYYDFMNGWFRDDPYFEDGEFGRYAGTADNADIIRDLIDEYVDGQNSRRRSKGKGKQKTSSISSASDPVDFAPVVAQALASGIKVRPKDMDDLFGQDQR